jgi:hypothetical protein
MVAGCIPKTILPFLNTGRGVVISKNEQGEVRPIVIGRILLRLIGSLAMSELSTDIQAFFLKPSSAIQFGVGMQGGCELMATAIALHLEAHEDHVDVSCDARNAFNSWCRSQLWDPLYKNFSSIYTFVKLVYGEAADIIFSEDGAGTEKILNSVGSRQGCSLGSFLYCLAIHPLLQILQAEFPDLLVLAYCDDIHIAGPPERAFIAYKRWAFLYGKYLQGELRDDKGHVYAKKYSQLDLINLGLPTGMEYSNRGTRILGAPVGSKDFWAEFAEGIVSDISRDFNVLGRLSNLQAQHIITCKSTIHRINHLLRNIPGGELDIFGASAIHYDDISLSVVRRICRSPDLPELAQKIARLPTSSGGLGLRSWKNVADAAFLAAYTNAAETIPRLFPERIYFETMLPAPITLFNPSTRALPLTQAPSNHSFFASRALARLHSRNPGVLGIFRPNTGDLTEVRTSRSLQHKITELVDATDLIIVKSLIQRTDDPSYPWRGALFNSNCGDTHTFNTVPQDKYTTFIDNRDFEIMYIRRLLMNLSNFSSERHLCPSCMCDSNQLYKNTNRTKLDEFGGHALHCASNSSGFRTKYWHNPLVSCLRNSREWLALRRKPKLITYLSLGLLECVPTSFSKEKTNLLTLS